MSFEKVTMRIDPETGRWEAHDHTWNLVTSGKTREEVERNIERVRAIHLENAVPVQ
jgi:hypothetical protein